MPKHLPVIIGEVIGFGAGILLVYYFLSASKRRVSKNKQTNHHLKWIKWFLIMFFVLLALAFLFFVLPYSRWGGGHGM